MRLRQTMMALAGALALAGAVAPQAEAQGHRFGDQHFRNREWVLLGQQDVGFRVDRDIINIGHGADWYRDRNFRALHFVAHGNDIFMISLRLIYLNGFSEEIRVNQQIRPGQDLPVGLRGERSFLRQVEMVYRARPNYQGRATVAVYGEPAGRPVPPPPPPGRPGAWVELGCQNVSLFGKDRDVIPVGRREGRFKSVRLFVRGADVEIKDIKVVYSNGEPDDVLVRTKIRAGERTRPLDLKGWQRSIDRVEMVYKTAFNPVDIVAKQRISTASVCVEGLQ